MIGKRFGRLTVLKKVDPPEHLKDKKSTYLLCECTCGNTKIVQKQKLTNGHTVSCGCHRAEIASKKMKASKTITGLSGTKFYRIWYYMKKRCTDPDYDEYENYGAKGIKIAEEWLDFENFMKDMYDSYIAFEEKHGEGSATLSRIDPDGDYTKDNCKWVTQSEKSRNKRSNISVVVDGVEYRSLSELAEAYNLNYRLVASRYQAGKRDKELVEPKKRTIKGVNSRGIQVEVNGKVYESLTALQKDYPYLSYLTLFKRYHRGLRGEDLIRKPRSKEEDREDQ